MCGSSPKKLDREAVHCGRHSKVMMDRMRMVVQCRGGVEALTCWVPQAWRMSWWTVLVGEVMACRVVVLESRIWVNYIHYSNASVLATTFPSTCTHNSQLT